MRRTTARAGVAGTAALVVGLTAPALGYWASGTAVLGNTAWGGAGQPAPESHRDGGSSLLDVLLPPQERSLLATPVATVPTPAPVLATPVPAVVLPVAPRALPTTTTSDTPAPDVRLPRLPPVGALPAVASAVALPDDLGAGADALSAPLAAVDPEVPCFDAVLRQLPLPARVETASPGGAPAHERACTPEPAPALPSSDAAAD